MPSKKLSARYPADLDTWKSLKSHCKKDLKKKTISSLFKSDSSRADKFNIEAGNLYLDYSKNIFNSKTIKIFNQLIKQARLAESIQEMFEGCRINASEDRPALHVALRSKLSDQVALDVDGVSDIWATLEKMDHFVSKLHDGKALGCTGKKIKNVINIGVGGSDLGVTMAVHALQDYWMNGLTYHSVSNGDGAELKNLLPKIDLEETLFIVCSKTFTTIETNDNAKKARKVIESQYGKRAVKNHFVGVSNNKKAMQEFGIQPDYQFWVSEWVGGRFSITSAMGISLACLIGMKNFYQFLEGARRMDLHFRQNKFEENIPMMLAMIAILNTNFFGFNTQAIITYSSRLKHFSAYIQQLHMESLGKNVRFDGAKTKIDTGSVIWGGSGSEGQHSYYQLLHQGTQCIPIDFILPVSDLDDKDDHYNYANCLAQSEALMDGSHDSQYNQIFDGNKPNNVILIDRLVPDSLGQIISMYEHKVFVQSVLYGINAFDQFGVELGKDIANSLGKTLARSSSYKGKNQSTRRLLSIIKAFGKSKSI
ncbi:MAG: glucose-6-phosphate isomerase [Pseudomonadota bacterium]|nr:glucose-6-phosphate isomerase [Pseudomonadota bacterium]